MVKARETRQKKMIGGRKEKRKKNMMKEKTVQSGGQRTNQIWVGLKFAVHLKVIYHHTATSTTTTHLEQCHTYSGH